MEKCKVERCLKPGDEEVVIHINEDLTGKVEPSLKAHALMLCNEHRLLLCNFGPDWFSIEEK